MESEIEIFCERAFEKNDRSYTKIHLINDLSLERFISPVRIIIDRNKRQNDFDHTKYKCW